MNKVFVNNHGLIEIVVDGDQTVTSVSLMADKAQQLVVRHREDGKPALILDNLLQIGAVSPDARKIVVERANKIEYDKLAMVGNGTALRLGANLLLQAIRKSKKVKYFEEYDQAVEWLKSDL